MFTLYRASGLISFVNEKIHQWPITTQSVEKNLIPWMHPKLSPDLVEIFIESNLRPLFRTEKQ